MATYDLEEQEKIDGLKSWWEVYGTLAIIIVATFIAGIFGTQAWKYYQKQQTDQAAELFVSLQEIGVGEDAKKIGDAARLLMEGFPGSGFASRAALISARASLDANDVQNARNQFQWLLVNSDEAELKDVARLRLAGLMLDEKKYDEALKLLESKHSEFFAGLYGDLKGDVLVAKRNISEARVAYKMAMDKIDRNGAHYKIVQMKLDALIEAK
jgi:predicted negative regulator of RcsB-dependent stress response